MNGRVEILQLASGALVYADRAPRRPLNSPGWGKLVAVKSGTLTGPDGEREQVKARVDRVAPDHWLATKYPDYFKPADRRDTMTATAHSRSLTRAKRQGSTRTRGRTASSALDVGSTHPTSSLNVAHDSGSVL